jgi:hypothetical protein
METRALERMGPEVVQEVINLKSCEPYGSDQIGSSG